MELNKQVASLELCKRLKELNVPQESLFYWGAYENPLQKIFKESDTITENWGLFSTFKNEKCPPDYIIAAFTCSELGEMLPYGSPTSRDETGWYMNVIAPLEKWKEMYPCYNESDARAKMIIHLIENGLMKI